MLHWSVYIQYKVTDDIINVIKFYFKYMHICDMIKWNESDAGLELQILRGTHFQGHSRRAPKATILKNTIEV